ncbi:bifunctional lysylphosphatidylglycerol flippase/synthetase MprF [Actinoplanes teichomyceticus]|uniref:Uncharacterized protein DUF2156 n=1 Tax=Actinoplanes teichomyceticus TaxID=1867 RepID=A0A561WLP2_ACTTI|nr:DUF2156 domain-containing protein [Actinoplanes teichomyceticus]TWG24782.1 uncharacterized protein DUF2156 [Actinoplanes teichomyceticus]GIF14556.1 hypothetical protein Ate01nite_45880 [Actinoplanes teichomyceticus]
MTDSPSPAEVALNCIRDYPGANNPSSFLAVNEGNEYFTLPGRPGVVAYRTAGRYLVQFGGPFAPAESYADLLHGFLDFARAQQRTVVAVQLQRDDVDAYARSGFTVNQIGASWAVDLARFTLAGTKFMQLRNKISRSFRAGLQVIEAKLDDWYDQMRELDAVWLTSKGEHSRELEFLVGQYGGEAQQHRRLFVGTIEDRLVGYISYSPVYGDRPGWMHDLSRRIPDRVPGIMEAINRTAIERFQSENVPWLHFGFTPFTGLAEENLPAGHSPGFHLLMQLLWLHGEAVYPAQTQLAYKQKWDPHVCIPEYVAFQGRASIAGLAHIFRASNALEV